MSKQEIDLVVSSLHGVSWKAQREGYYAQLPRITAAVAFAGSASNMQISSSSMCNRTGHLVIESDSCQLDLEEDFQFLVNHNEDDENTLGLLSLDDDGAEEEQPRPVVLGFREPVEDKTYSSPHVKICLPQPDKAPPMKSLTAPTMSSYSGSSRHGFENGGDSWNAEIRSFVYDDHDSCQHTNDSNGSSQQEPIGLSRGPSLIWSNAHFMPEIVELHVSISSDDSDDVLEGIAHLVVFSDHQDHGRLTLDLPIKHKGMPSIAADLCNRGSQQSTSSEPIGDEYDSSLLLAEDAYIRIQLNVLADKSQQKFQDVWNDTLATASSISTSATEMSSSGPVSIFSNDRQNEAKLRDILQQIKANEEMALARCRAAKLQINSERIQKEKMQMPDERIPGRVLPTETPKTRNTSYNWPSSSKKKGFSQMLFCDTMPIGEAFEALTEVLTPSRFRKNNWRRNSTEHQPSNVTRTFSQSRRRNSLELNPSSHQRHILLNKRLSASPRLGNQAPQILPSASTMGSTIATRESLDI